MTRTQGLWLVLGALYLAFLGWHQPLRGPLTAQEVEAAFGARFGQIRGAEDPRAARLIDFFLSDDGRPFYMVNLNALTDDSAGATEAAETYGAYMAPRLLARASYPVLWSDPRPALNNSLGAGLDRVERLVVVRYRSRRDFMQIIATPGFRKAINYKYVSLDGWYSAAAPASPVIPLPLFVLILLISIAALPLKFMWRRHH